MKRSISLVTMIIILSCIAGSAWAIPWTWTDKFIPQNGPIYFDNGTYGVTKYQINHNITDNGFDPLQDLITTYVVSMNLFDDRDGAKESVKVDLPGVIADRTFNFNYLNPTFGMSLLGWIQLETTGKLTINLYRLTGDFYLGDSTLTVNGYETNPPVPEPATLLLLGSGLLGLGLAGFRRTNK